MELFITEFDSNPNIGLYMYVTEKYCLCGKELDEKRKEKIEKTLGVPIIRISMAGTSLVGVFCAGNSNKLLVPEVVFESELKILKKNKIDYQVIKTNLTAFGNNMIVNDNGAVISEEMGEKVRSEVEKALGVKTVFGDIADLNIVGSLAVLRNDRCLIHPDASSVERKILMDTLKVKIADATINFGSPYLSSGIVANSSGMIVGSASSGPEINNAENELGFLDE